MNALEIDISLTLNMTINAFVLDCHIVSFIAMMGDVTGLPRPHFVRLRNDDDCHSERSEDSLKQLLPKGSV